ncbi:MAG TPA: hypothetical protein VME67_09755 [Mycobacterium sp.]|nr:hypothetical protein [Mycobacterium sp.]HTX95094.1 hypothetical protein [Mycobacterium sp.]
MDNGWRRAQLRRRWLAGAVTGAIAKPNPASIDHADCPLCGAHITAVYPLGWLTHGDTLIDWSGPA